MIKRKRKRREEDMVISRAGFRLWLGLLLSLAALPAGAADKLIPLEVALGDVSLNKVSFLIAADAGIYDKNGLDVIKFITTGACSIARNSCDIVAATLITK